MSIVVLRKLCFLAVISAGLMATTAIAAETTDNPDRVWLISTRQQGEPCETQIANQPVYWRLEPDWQWNLAEPAAFLKENHTAEPTVFFVHGNRTDRCEAVSDGWRVYASLKQHVAGRPFRFVIWSWPADRIPGRTRPDAQVKTFRSELESYYLATTVAQMPVDARVSMIGYSLGSRAIAGALQLLAGGEFAGRKLTQPPPARAPMRAILIAPAVDAGGMEPQGPVGLALMPTDGILGTYNLADTALRWYPRLFGKRGPEALGYIGPSGCTPHEKMQWLDLGCEVGRGHEWELYWSSPSLQARLPWYALFLEP